MSTVQFRPKTSVACDTPLSLLRLDSTWGPVATRTTFFHSFTSGCLTILCLPLLDPQCFLVGTLSWCSSACVWQYLLTSECAYSVHLLTSLPWAAALLTCTLLFFFGVANTLVSLLCFEHWCQQCLTWKSVHSAWTVTLRTALLCLIVACLKGELNQLNT